MSSTIKKSTGTLLVAASVLFFAKGYQLHSMGGQAINHTFWLGNYTDCLAQAKKENKKILLDISAPYCSICKAIDKKMFMNETVQQALSGCVVPVKIDELDAQDPIHAKIQQQFNVVGVPTLLLIDPADETQLICWGSELYDYEPEAFVSEVRKRVG